MSEESKAAAPNLPQAMVTVYGAGVAGLTAAHELIERGFSVTVVEPEPDPFNAQECAVGGMARTQWSRVPRIERAQQRLDPAEAEASQPIPPILGMEFSEYRYPPWNAEVAFSPGTADPSGATSNYLRRRVEELLDLLKRVPVVDPSKRTRLFVPEVVYFAGTWADDDLPAKDSFAEVPSKRGNRKINEILGESERDRFTPLERWLRALVVARCECLMQEFLTILSGGDSGQFDGDWDSKGQRAFVFRHLAGGGKQLVARLERLVLDDGYSLDKARQLHERRVVRVFIGSNKLSGEHGYRFFPAFYWHVFDTMKRIPLTEPEPRGQIDYRREVEDYFRGHGDDWRKVRPRQSVDQPQGRTVRDNLIPLPYHTITGPGGAPIKLTRTPTASLKGALQVIRDFQRAMDLTVRDIARMQVKLLQYLTSCNGRRNRYAKSTWLEYLGGPYSEGFKRAMINWPRALVGLQADMADARTYGDVAVQLVLDQIRGDSFRDATLNGPTSTAWLEPWRQYLQAQGVRFQRGRLIDLTLTDEGEVEGLELIAEDGGTACSPVPRMNREYTVIAVPPVEARQLSVSLSKRAEQLGGAVWEDFQSSDFAPMCTLLDTDGRTFQLEDLGREHIGGVLQHYSGIQFFLDQDHALFVGHAYYADSPWALSSISQVQFRLDPPDPTDGYRGVVSVDVGSWDTPGLDDKTSAWYSSSRAIADEVWQQICVSMGVGDRRAARRPSTPRWYHLDTGILRRDDEHGERIALEFARLKANDAHVDPESDPARARAEWRARAERSPILAIDSVATRLRSTVQPGMPYFNRTPYLVSIAGSRDRSPGKPGKYGLFRGVVMAGTHMKTHTRLATMEAANESGRHAANAILADYRERVRKLDVDLRLDIRVGEPCKIWPLVDRELPDLEFLKKIDAALLRRGLPHMFEILEVEQIVDELVPRGEGVEGAAEGSVDIVDKIVGMLEQLTAAQPGGAGAFVLAPLQALLDGLRARR